MGMFLGNEIVQSLAWIDPKAVDKSHLDYKKTFPITVFSAVRAEMDNERSETLQDVLTRIAVELDRRQTIIPAKPANFLVTYAGAPGEVGSIGISDDIPWDTSKQRDDRIPTERAVGQLLLKLGYLDANGQPTDPSSKVMWDDITGKPKSYDETGTGDDGFMTQRAVTAAINDIRKLITDSDVTTQSTISAITSQISEHESDKNNPHCVTAEQIGAVDLNVYQEHIAADNPHNISAYTIGLGNVDNTADTDKPISKATQDALDTLQHMISGLGQDVNGINVNNVVDIDFDRVSSKLTVSFENGDSVSTFIPINDIVSNVTLDRKNRRMIITKISGEEKVLPLDDVFYKIAGSDGASIIVEIDESKDGVKSVKANIRPGSITAEMLNPDVNFSGNGFTLTNSCITTIHLADQSVTSEKIGNGAVGSNHVAERAIIGKHLFTSTVPDMILAVRNGDADPEWSKIVTDMLVDGVVTTEKLGDKAVTNDKVADLSISGGKLVVNPHFIGTPSISQRPDDKSTDSSVPDTKWVMDRLDQQVLRNKNIGQRIIRGNNLFTSARGDEVLLVPSPNVNPEWGKITDQYIAEESIGGDRLKDASITAKQLKDESVTPEKLFHSTQPYQIMAVLQDTGKPVWSKVTKELLAEGAVGEKHLQDGSIGLSKLPSSEDDFVLIGVHATGSTPKWTKVLSTMIEDRSIVPRHIFTSDESDRVLAIQQKNGDPLWTQVTGPMIASRAIEQDHIGDGEIINRHLGEEIIESKHIRPRSISGDKLVPRSVTGTSLFSSPYPNQVLAVINPYDHPQWTNITADMLGDFSISAEKLIPPDAPYRVLASTTAGKHPEFIRIDGRYIAGESIEEYHLKKNINLPGKPTVTETPDMGADNSLIPNTHWVRKYVNGVLGKAEEDVPTDIGVLSVLNPGEEPKYRKVSQELMEDESVGSNQLTDSIQLRGLPTIIRRPDASASDVAGDGTLIPDCQWVLDRIKDAVKNLSVGGGTTTPITPDDSEWDDFDDWAEMRDTAVQETWDTDGAGEVTSDDEDEIPESFIQEVWNNDGAGDVATTDEYELTYEQVKAIWDNPGTGTGTNSGTTTPSGNDWIEMDTAGVETEWSKDGEGDLTADEGELNDTDVRDIWSANGEGDITADDAEITEETVKEIWNGGWADPSEPDLTPGQFPGSSGSSGTTPSTPSGGTNGTATKLDGEGIVHHEHLGDRIVNGRKLFTSLTPNVVLTVEEPDMDPKWSKIIGEMLEPDTITEDKLDPALREKINERPEVSNGITNIPDHSIDDSKIADHSITGRKLARKTQIPAYTTVEPQTDYEKKSVRNIIISHRTPRGGSNGDIWFRYY